MSTFEEPRTLPAGAVVRSTYLVEQLLGAGAFGAVYRVKHRFLGLKAMKVFHDWEAAPKADAVMEEGRILSSLIHENIVRLFDANTLDLQGDERPYLTMEYVSGGTLEALLDKRVRLHPLSALKTARQICAGLAVAHGSKPPIVHRDITGRNVLIDAFSAHGTPQVKIGDFGLARHVDPDSLMARAAGTIAYMAPEASWGFHTAASDVYSLGVLLYRMLTGMFPFPMLDSAEVGNSQRAREAMLRSRRNDAKPPSMFRLGLTADVDDVVCQALSPAERDRFKDAEEFGRALDPLITEVS